MVDKRGAPDREGRALEVTLVAQADEVAAAASLLMGQTDEGRPLVCIRGLLYDATASSSSALHRAAEKIFTSVVHRAEDLLARLPVAIDHDRGAGRCRHLHMPFLAPEVVRHIPIGRGCVGNSLTAPHVP